MIELFRYIGLFMLVVTTKSLYDMVENTKTKNIEIVFTIGLTLSAILYILNFPLIFME